MSLTLAYVLAIAIVPFFSGPPQATDEFGSHKNGPWLNSPEVKYFMEINSGHKVLIFIVSHFSGFPQFLKLKIEVTQAYLSNITNSTFEQI